LNRKIVIIVIAATDLSAEYRELYFSSMISWP